MSVRDGSRSIIKGPEKSTSWYAHVAPSQVSAASKACQQLSSTLHSAHELRHSDIVFSLFICIERNKSDTKVCQSCAVM